MTSHRADSPSASASPAAAVVRVPGKAMVAGEYAVLAGAPAIVCAVDRYLVCERRPAPKFALEGAGARWREAEPAVPGALRFAAEALRVARAYLAGCAGAPPADEPSALRLVDALRAPNGSKLGLGGSACTCVAVVAAALASEGRGDGPLAGGAAPAHRARVCALAALAHANAQGRAGSGADVAAASFGGTLWVHQLPVADLAAALRAGDPAGFARVVDAAAMTSSESGGGGFAATLPVEPLESPFAFALVYSGTSASTAALIERVDDFARRAPERWGAFVDASRAACERLRRAMAVADEVAAREAIAEGEQALEQLGAEAGAPLVVDAHRAIAAEARRHGLAAKPSGAGGGDCSLVLGGSAERIDAFVEAMRAAGRYAFRPAVARGFELG